MRIYPLLCLVSLLLLSCGTSFLDLDPYTEIPASSAIRSTKDLQAALNGCYAQLRSPALFGRTLPVIGDLAADNVYISTRNSGKYLAFEQQAITADNADYKAVWLEAYRAILRANNVIDAQLPADSAVTQLKGEARGLRAWLYFTLARTFARPYTVDPEAWGVPLVLHRDPDARPVRSTLAVTYRAIKADLDSAARMMTGDFGSARLSRFAAVGLRSKVNLYAGDYAAALADARGVIDAGGFTLLSYTAFTGYWASAAPQPAGQKLETLFEVSSDAALNAGSDELAYLYQQNAYGDLLAAASLAKLYAPGDIRGKLIISGRRDAAENPAWIVNKFAAAGTEWDDKKILRLSEIYLIAAEAAFRLGRETDARNYLNRLVRERDPSFQYATSGAALLEDIITERRKELAFEGDRLHDLNRLHRDIQRKDGRFPGTIPFTAPTRIGPIPETELIENANLVQNEGY